MYKKILAPLDGSEFSECSLSHVKAIARGCQTAEIILLTVVEPISAQTMAAYAQAGVDIPAMEKQYDIEAEKYIAKLAKKLRIKDVNVKTVVAKGHPADQIMDYAGKNKIDLIVMSTHGRSGLSRWVMGSVTDKVVNHSAVPVLTISPLGCRLGG